MMIGFAHGIVVPIVVPIVVDLYHRPDRCPDHHRTPMTDAGCHDRLLAYPMKNPHVNPEAPDCGTIRLLMASAGQLDIRWRKHVRGRAVLPRTAARRQFFNFQHRVRLDLTRSPLLEPRRGRQPRRTRGDGRPSSLSDLARAHYRPDCRHPKVAIGKTATAAESVYRWNE